MSSIKVILNSSLSNEECNIFCNKSNKLELDLSDTNCYFGEYEKTERLLEKEETPNNFVNAFLHAYNLHKTIRIRPDDIKLQLLMVISTFVNNNSEKMRSFFVDHEGKEGNEGNEGKEELEITTDYFSADYFCKKFSDLLENNIKCPEFSQHFKSTFSTTTPIIQTVNNMTLMNTLKEYFSYTMICSCGIPSIVLDGTQEDWINLKITYEYFKSITINSELKDWYTHFDIIFNMFIEIRMLKELGEIDEKDTPENIKELFKRVISYIPQGSGSDNILGGWIRLFCPYSSSNKLIGGLNKQIECLDITKESPSEKDYSYYDLQDKMAQYYFGCDWDSISSSFITTPVKLIYYGVEYQVEFYSGFFQPHLNELDEITMNIGYIMREDMVIKDNNLKEIYLKKGVIIENIHRLKIPFRLKNQASEISKVFNICVWEYYNLPEDEKKMKFYLDNGVEKVSYRVYSFMYNIPEKFKDDIKDILMIFNIDETKIKFI